jgi:hypothetical protein
MDSGAQRSSATALDVDISHRQFYLLDGPTFPNAFDPALFWIEHPFPSLGAITGMVGVGTTSFFGGPVDLEVWRGEPPVDPDADQIVDASLAITTGQLHVGWSDFDRINVPPDMYRVRAAGYALERGSEADQGGDHYRVQIWPSAESPMEIIRAWTRPR